MFLDVVPQLADQRLVEPLHLPISLGVVWGGEVYVHPEEVHHPLVENGPKLWAVIRKDRVGDIIAGDPDVEQLAQNVEGSDVLMGTTLVSLLKRSHITRRYSYPSGVRGSGPSISTAMAANGSAAGNRRIAVVRFFSMRRFFAQVSQEATSP